MKIMRVLWALFVLSLFVLACTIGFVVSKRDAKQQGPWPGKTISYYNNTSWKRSLDAAVHQWNKADIGIKLVEVKDVKRAQVIIRQMPYKKLQSYCPNRPGNCAAYASRGYQKQGGYIVLSSPTKASAYINDQDIRIIVHEFGHVLGLDHTQQEDCSVMTPDAHASGCPVSNFFVDNKVLCGPTKEDVTTLARMYGVAPTKKSTANCKAGYSDSQYNTMRTLDLLSRCENMMRLGGGGDKSCTNLSASLAAAAQMPAP